MIEDSGVQLHLDSCADLCVQHPTTNGKVSSSDVWAVEWEDAVDVSDPRFVVIVAPLSDDLAYRATTLLDRHVAPKTIEA